MCHVRVCFASPHITDKQYNTNQSHDDATTTMNTNTAAEEYHWVLVYGFSQHQREDVLSHFRHVGDVMDVRTTAGSRDSNWMAIAYESALAVEQALILGGQRFFFGGRNNKKKQTTTLTIMAVLLLWGCND